MRIRTRVALVLGSLVALAAAPPAMAQYETLCTDNSLCISDVNVMEGNAGTSVASFAVTISPARAGPVDVHYLTMPGEGTATPNADYTPVSAGTVTIPAGQTAVQVSITIIGDTVAEPNESFFVHLDRSSPAVTISKHHGNGTIMDDDGGGGGGGGGGGYGPDTTPPNTYIHGGPGRVTRSRSASFHLASTEAGSRFQCKLDARPWRACRARLTLRRLARGLHTLRVRAIDPAGNVDRTPARKTWRIR